MTEATDDTELSLKLFRVLARAYGSLVAHSDRDCRSHGLHPTEFAVLELLYHRGPQPLQRIGAKILLASGSVTYVIDKLEAAGLLHRQPCPEDRRVIHAVLTEKGRELLGTIFPQHAETLHQAMAGLSAVEKAVLIPLLKKLGLAAAQLLEER